MGDALVAALAQVITNMGGGDTVRRGDFLVAKKGEEVGQIGLVGGKGVLRQPPFGGKIVQEQVLKSQ